MLPVVIGALDFQQYEGLTRVDMGLFARLFGRHFRAEVENCIHIAATAIAVRLFKKYAHKYPERDFETVSALAGAVTNELFGAPPSNETARQFLAANKEWVEVTLHELVEEPEICAIVSLLTHTRANIAGNTGTVTPEMVLSWRRLHDAGILLPIEKIQIPHSPEDLMRQVRGFELWTMKN